MLRSLHIYYNTPTPLFDWFPWREEDFEKAKCENKPFLVSIGYSNFH
ncbi:DUF255 domain-containing protein [Bacillus sp. SA116]|nr:MULTISPECIES: DUF255 domain-containing protein [Bacillus]UUT26097.1 DUF255 domain-containing protein [Bacillus velezensis]MDM5457461.1 DUF255 domain-containing protein [Bacillus subtilis]RAP10175.1 hypothetical protein HS3_00584 [Bacillus subtilis]UVV87979.1 DUF255 domain-containing protein [Bacillus subtilis]UZJ46833.1 DUF255 domain-containing protein [Bacillus subtilis]